MSTAYTPGLTVTERTAIVKKRILPLKGQVLVKVGDKVTPSQVVARAELPGDVVRVKIHEKLGIDVQEMQESYLKKYKPGESVIEGEVLAERKAMFGLFTSLVKSPIAGKIDYWSPATGNMGIRKPPKPVEINAYIAGEVSAIYPNEGVEIATRAALVQGIFGVGGERQGQIKVLVDAPSTELTVDRLPPDCKDLVLVGGNLIRAAALKEAGKRGAKGVVIGGVIDEDLAAFVGYDIGVAITGQEDVPLTLIMTEGFGPIPMADRTFKLLKRLEGREASINGATQIRAGAQRPEIIVPGGEKLDHTTMISPSSNELRKGTVIRIIRVPYFGQIAKVTELPPELTTIETGAKVRVLECEITSGADVGKRVMVPRANVEIMVGS